MVKKYLLAHDVGTSGDKAVLADIQGQQNSLRTIG